jgi:hypothetical protein
MLTDWNKKDVGYEEVNNLVIFQYPSGKAELPEYIPENIRKFYREALDAYNLGLLNSASIMCRKVIYKLCDKKKSVGKDYKEKIKKAKRKGVWEKNFCPPAGFGWWVGVRLPNATAQVRIRLFGCSQIPGFP